MSLRPYMMETVKIADPIKYFVEWLSTKKFTPSVVIEIGASYGNNLYNKFNAKYINIDCEKNDNIPTIVKDISGYIFDEIEEGIADIVYSNNLMEHVQNPFLAAQNMTKLLKDGGFLFCRTPFAYRFHAMPNDYWRFSPEGLKILFRDLKCIEANLDDVIRRKNFTGSFKNGYDKVPVDDLGGWRESWMSYFIGQK